MTYPADAPFKKTKIDLKKAFSEGLDTGRNWKSTYRPGGPFVCNVGHDRDPEWAEYCRLSAERNRQWLLGFDQGREEQQKEK